jgi:hypothetical protein
LRLSARHEGRRADGRSSQLHTHAKENGMAQRTTDEMRELLRESRSLRGNPGAQAAFDQLDQAAAEGMTHSQYLDGVEGIVRRFKR